MKTKQIIKELKYLKTKFECTSTKEYKNEIDLIDETVKLIETQDKIIGRYDNMNKDVNLFGE